MRQNSNSQTDFFHEISVFEHCVNDIFQVSWSLLDKLPQTRLGRLRKCRSEEEILELADGYDPEKNEFYFNRQPRNFSCILNFLSTGKLHLGEETCVIAFSQVHTKQLGSTTPSIIHWNPTFVWLQ